MKYSRVYSGQTETIGDTRAGWYKGLKEKRLEWEDVVDDGSLNDVLSKLVQTPLNFYIVNYLSEIWKDELSDNMTYETRIEELVRKLKEQFETSGMPEEKCRYAYVKKMLTTEWSREWDSFEKAGTKRIFELAMGMQIPVEDVNMFLQKAVKRAGFNYYDPEELLAYCVIRFQKNYRFRCYRALQADYKKLKPVQAQRGTQKGETVAFENTQAIRSALEHEFESIDSIYENNVFEAASLNENLKSFLSIYKAAAPDKRTASVKFYEMLNELLSTHRKEFLSFKASARGREEYAHAVLEIEYDGNTGGTIGQDTTFYSVSKKDRGKASASAQYYFKPVKEEILPKMEWVEIIIPVRGIEAHEICEKKKETPGYVKKDVELQMENRASETKIRNIFTYQPIKYTGEPGKVTKAEGKLRIVCRPGTEIKEKERFICGEYVYEALKTVTARTTAEIEVQCTTPFENEKKVVDTGCICRIKKEIPYILSVTNPKPVRMKLPTETISRELLREFLYNSDPEGLNNEEEKVDARLLGKWFTDTEITSVRFSNIQTPDRKNKVRRSDIITLAFLIFCMDTDSIQGDCLMEEDAESIYQDFLRYVNPILKECGMMPFYLENPYERLLAYLMQTDTPVDSLRNLWKIANFGKGEKNG